MSLLTALVATLIAVGYIIACVAIFIAAINSCDRVVKFLLAWLSVSALIAPVVWLIGN